MCALFNGISGVTQRQEEGERGALSIMDQIGFEVPDQYIPLQVNGFGENSPRGSTHQQCEWPIV